MLDTRALFLAAAAAAGFTPCNALALTPLEFDVAIEPSAAEPSAHAAFAPLAFERAPDEAYEPTARIANGGAGLQCVPFARQESGLEIYGNASTWWEQARAWFDYLARCQLLLSEGLFVADVLYFYGDQVMELADVIQEQLNIIAR